MSTIKGIISPILTPMHADETIHELELRKQVPRHAPGIVPRLQGFATRLPSRTQP